MKMLSSLLFEQASFEDEEASTTTTTASEEEEDSWSVAGQSEVVNVDSEKAASLMRLPGGTKSVFERSVSEETTATCSTAASAENSPLGASSDPTTWPKVADVDDDDEEKDRMVSLFFNINLRYCGDQRAETLMAVGRDGVAHYVAHDFGDFEARGDVIAVARNGEAKFVPADFGHVNIGECKPTSLILVSPDGTAHYRPCGDVPDDWEQLEIESEKVFAAKETCAKEVRSTAFPSMQLVGAAHSLGPDAEDKGDGHSEGEDLSSILAAYATMGQRSRRFAGSVPRSPSLKRLSSNLFLGRRLRM
jgi:hypothetical protein